VGESRPRHHGVPAPPSAHFVRRSRSRRGDEKRVVACLPDAGREPAVGDGYPAGAMLDTSALTVFLLASLVLLLTPGPAVLYIIARSIDQGRGAGIASVLGVALGTMVHVVGAALGLSALLAKSAVAYSVVKYLGAVYLIYLGIRRLRGSDAGAEPGRTERSLRRVFTQGIWVNVLNPKTALFFLAFLPQFVDVDRGAVALQFLLLGAVFVAMGVVTDGLYALAAGTFGEWLWRRPKVIAAQRYLTGGIFVTLGVATALSGSKD